jgi:HD superfamily phosphohydrolase
MTYLVYPGAMHSRFEHSLGVMELATRAFELLVRRRRKMIQTELKQVPELADNTIPKARQIVRLMALLHDIGQPPFSHGAEKTMPGGDYEKLSVYVIREVMGQEIDRTFFDGASGLLGRLMEKTQELTFLREFVASQMDMDRTDYLRRDSIHCGVDYGVFDSSRLIESLTVIENPYSGRLQLAVQEGGEHTFEALILARYQMNTQVYLHRVRRIYDHYLTEYMKLWGAENYRSLDDVLKHDDISVLTDIRRDARADNERSLWARRIVDRKHHREVQATGDSADEPQLRKMRKVCEDLEEAYPSVDFYLDDSMLAIHKLTVPGDQDAQAVEDLFIVPKHGSLKRLSTESAIIGKIPKTVRTVRIFADAQEGLLKTIRAKASRMMEAQP